MSIEERIASLEEENRKLKEDNAKLMAVVAQMRTTLNRLIGHYIAENE